MVLSPKFNCCALITLRILQINGNKERWWYFDCLFIILGQVIMGTGEGYVNSSIGPTVE